MSLTLKITFRSLKNQFTIVGVTLLIIVVAMLGGCSKKKSEQPPDGTKQTLRFVFLADSRGGSLDNPVNLPVMQAIVSQIGKLSPKPAFVVFGGDMSYRGYIGNSYTFQAFKDLFAPLADSAIPLYTAIGNHELNHENPEYGFLLVNQQEYQKVFSENPANGPAGYEHLAYSFTDTATSSFFAVLDPYFVDKDTVHMSLGGKIGPAQMTWLESQVAQTNATHKFLFIHTPLYYVSDDPEEPSLADTSETKLWAFLDANKFDMYTCGHLHLYSRKTIDSSVPPDPQTVPATPAWQNHVVQLLNGSCGAPLETHTIDPAKKASWNVHNDVDTYYFSVVDVSGSTVTVNSYGGNTGAYTIIDTFTITK